jgi:hypothetical protein
VQCQAEFVGGFRAVSVRSGTILPLKQTPNPEIRGIFQIWVHPAISGIVVLQVTSANDRI